MGLASAEEYEIAAQKIVANPQCESTVREDLSTVYYNFRTNDFVIVRPDGYLSTYYRPDDGQEYWLRELDASQ